MENNNHTELKIESKVYQINGKKYLLYDDLTIEELEWIEKVYNKLSASENYIYGNFTINELLKTIKIVLRNEDGSYCNDKELKKIPQSLIVKIIADFFLSNALLGTIMQKYSELLMKEKIKHIQNMMN